MAPIFIDGVGSVRVANGIAHIDLVTVLPPSSEGGQQTPEVSQRLTMTMPNFVRMCAEMAKQLQRMEERGLITRNRPAAS